MDDAIEKVTAGWPVPVEAKRSFTEFCAKSGSLAQEDCAGALVMWQYLPAQIREWARLEAKGIPSVDKEFWRAFEAGLQAGITSQLRNLQQKQGP